LANCRFDKKIKGDKKMNNCRCWSW